MGHVHRVVRRCDMRLAYYTLYNILPCICICIYMFGICIHKSYIASECSEMVIQWVGYLWPKCRIYILVKLIVQNIHVFRTASLDQN